MLEAIQQIWKQERNATTQESEAVMSAALALYDEVERKPICYGRENYEDN
jgi:uncharacterized protein